MNEPKKRCSCLRPIATKEENAKAHAAGKCAVCYQIEQYAAACAKTKTCRERTS